MERIEIYLENGDKASLEDVCNWWIQNYPKDIFVNKPKPVVKIRENMQMILNLNRKPEVSESHNNQQTKPCEVSSDSPHE